MRRLPHPDQPNDRGSSLIEVITAMSIVAVISAISIPMYLSQQGKAIDVATTLELRKAQNALVTDLIEDPSRTNFDLSDAGISSAEHVTITLTSPIDDATFCLTANAPEGKTPVMSTDQSGLIYPDGTCGT